MPLEKTAGPAERGGRLDVDFPATAIVDHVSFALESGRCLAVMGPSGVGKTTLLRKIADLDPHDGRAAIGGQTQESMPGPVWRSMVMFVSSEAAWWADTVRAHFAAGDHPMELMAHMALPEQKLDMIPQQLSSGERQRMALIRAMLRKPRFLLLDEPTSALDAETTLRVEAVLNAVKATGTGIVLVTHDEAQAERLADDFLMMKALHR